MNSITRFREHFKKSEAVLDLIEQNQIKLDCAIAHYNLMMRMFGDAWENRRAAKDAIQLQKAERRLLINQFADMQVRHCRMIELGKLVDSTLNQQDEKTRLFG